MRILNMVLTRASGGDTTMALRYHEALVAEGYDVLSLGRPDGPLASSLDSKSFRPLISQFIHDPVAAVKLARHNMAFKPDLVLAHGNRAGRMCLMPLLNIRHKTVQVLHTPSFKPHLKKLKAAICVSGGVSQAAQEAFPGLKVFEMANFSHLYARTIKTAPLNCPVIGAMGRLHGVKGFDLLIKAAAKLRDTGVEFRLKIAGDGPELPALKSLCESLHLTDRVDFCGWAAAPLEFISGLDLFVVPSRYESRGFCEVRGADSGVTACEPH